MPASPSRNIVWSSASRTFIRLRRCSLLPCVSPTDPSSLLLGFMSKFLLGLIHRCKQVLQRDIVNGGVSAVSDSRVEPVIPTEFHPQEHHLLELGRNLIGDDQVGLCTQGLGLQGLCGGEDHLGAGALLADVESEYFPVHLRLYSHQYAYYYLRCHERGTPSVHENKVHAHEGHRDHSRVYRNYCIIFVSLATT